MVEKGWFWYAGDFPMGWEKRVKVTNPPILVKKGSTSRSTKTIKKSDDSFETFSEIVPFEGGLPLIGNIVLENSPHPSTRTRSSRCLLQASLGPLLCGHVLMLLLLARPEVAKGRHLPFLRLPQLSGEYVI